MYLLGILLKRAGSLLFRASVCACASTAELKQVNIPGECITGLLKTSYIFSIKSTKTNKVQSPTSSMAGGMNDCVSSENIGGSVLWLYCIVIVMFFAVYNKTHQWTITTMNSRYEPGWGHTTSVGSHLSRHRAQQMELGREAYSSQCAPVSWNIANPYVTAYKERESVPNDRRHILQLWRKLN